MEKKALHLGLILFSGALLFLAMQRAANEKSAAGAGASGVTVYIFLAEECPVSQSATLALKELYHKYAGGRIAFAGVFANASSTAESVAQFRQKYEMPFPLQWDDENRLLHLLGARVTPEAFVLDHSTWRVLYRGRIDDSFAGLGQRRQVITAHELQDALDALTTGRPIAVKETQALGCFITPR